MCRLSIDQKTIAIAATLSVAATALPFLWGVQKGHLIALLTYQTTVCFSCVYTTRFLLSGAWKKVLARAFSPEQVARTLVRTEQLYSDDINVQAALQDLKTHFCVEQLCQRLAAQEHNNHQ